MEMNEAGYSLLMRFENCRLTAYQDITGRWTIGHGHTSPDIYEGLTWTQAQANEALVKDTQCTVDELLDLIEPELSDNQFSALVCLAYNIGTHAFAGSSALNEVNHGLLYNVPKHIVLWNKARINGILHVSRGLARRRAAEVVLWNTKE